MSSFESIVEARIRDAIARGDFDELAGKGRPLALEDLSAVPEDLRAGYLLLKNAGVLPEEMQLRKEMVSLEALLDACADPWERTRLRRDLRLEDDPLSGADGAAPAVRPSPGIPGEADHADRALELAGRLFLALRPGLRSQPNTSLAAAANASNAFSPSPCKTEPCIVASVFGRSAASRASVASVERV